MSTIRGHAVHDPAGGVQGPAASLHGPDGHSGGHAGGEPVTGRDRGAHRASRQHARPENGPVGRADLPHADPARPSGGAGRVLQPGSAVRAARRSAAAGAQPELLAAVPGAVRRPECGPDGRDRPAGAPRGDPGVPPRHDEDGPDAAGRGGRRGLQDLLGIQHGSLRGGDHRANGATLRGAAGRARGGSEPAGQRAAPAVGARAGADARRVECDGRAAGRRTDGAGPHRAQPRAAARCAGGRRRRDGAHLRRAEPARKPPGPSAAGARCRSQRGGRHRGRAVGGAGHCAHRCAQGRRRLPAAGSVVSGRPAAVHGGRCRRRRGGRPRGAVAPRATTGGDADPPGHEGGTARRSAVDSDRRGSGVRRLHVGLDRDAERRGDPTPGARERARVHGADAGDDRGRRAAGGDEPVVRHRRAGVVPAADGRCQGRDRRSAGSPRRTRASGPSAPLGGDGHAGDARHVANAAGRRLAGGRGAQGAVRRRGIDRRAGP